MENQHHWRQIILNYIQAYNSFDVEQMLADFHPNIVFRNISNGEITLHTQGIQAFRTQAEKALTLFREREQTVRQMAFSENGAEVQIDYRGKIALDLPNGMKAGDEIRLSGLSKFRFNGNQIIEITDIS
jgi:hypothetical protein